MPDTLPHNPDAQPFWEAAKAQRLILRKCDSCGHIHFPPRHLCPSCWSEALSWVDASGAGRIYSYTIVHRAPNPTFATKVPYVVALIELDEGPRLIANLEYDTTRPPAIDDRVRVYFEGGPDGVTRPQFRKIEQSAGAQ